MRSTETTAAKAGRGHVPGLPITGSPIATGEEAA